MLINDTMRELLDRSPPDARYVRRAARRNWKFESDGRVLAFVPPIAQPVSAEEAERFGLRTVDLDEASTRVEMDRVAQKNFTSAAFQLVWQVAEANFQLRTSICASISILDDQIVTILERTWPSFLPSCRVGFFRGRENEYLGDVSKTVGAVAIIPFGEIRIDRGYGDFLAQVTSARSN